jgi:Domain of unknown function (DUF1707)
VAGPDDLRVSDDQRERAVSEIREHFAAGRLNDDELSDRVQAAYSARTQVERELDARQRKNEVRGRDHDRAARRSRRHGERF